MKLFVPRNRKARLAILGSAARRASASSSLARDRKSLRRRITVVALVLLSLTLLTFSFREQASGPLHSFEGHAGQVLKPFQVVADRVAKPFEDAYNWTRDVLHAKKENHRLRAELERLRQQRETQKNNATELARLKKILNFQSSRDFPQDYSPVNVDVLTPATGAFEQTIVIASGKNRDIQINDPVIAVGKPVGKTITVAGLVGRISSVGPVTSRVTLISDPGFAVSARDFQTGVEGIVRHPANGSDALMLENVKVEQSARLGDTIVTAGWLRADLNSLYPRDLPIGSITSINQSDVNPEKQIQIDPSVDLSSLSIVTVLIPKHRSASGG